MTKLSKRQGNTLLKLARSVIDRRLGGDSGIPEIEGDELQSKGGTFVTLKKKGQLRGCIGNITPTGSIWESVSSNAVSAAFFDHRFSELSRDELDAVLLSVSILTPEKKLKYNDAEDLCSKLRPFIDGVILKKGDASATFLPQVWEQLPDPELFLTQLCLKAGLDGKCWKNDAPEIRVYQVQSFSEEKE